MRAALVIAILAAAAAPALAQPGGLGGSIEPRAQLRLEDRDAYAGVPFVLSLAAEGFDESPPPQQPVLAIPGVRVSALGGTPSLMQMNINGQRMDRVTWVFRWRLEAEKPGDYTVPALTLTQGAKKATTKSARLSVGELPTTEDMRLEVGLPGRPVWVGETITVPIRWLLHANPQNQEFSVPLLGMDDVFLIAAPPAKDPRQALAFTAGSRDLQLPYTRDDVTVDGTRFARFSFEVMVTPTRAGTIELPASSVAAHLEVSGGRRDFFGNAPTKLFRVADAARTLEVKPLPQVGRPPGFAGAVGTSFSLGVRASRSVVSLGEPVDLEITVRSDQRLDALALGPLAAAGLPADKFAAPDQPPPGELADDARTKTFTVPVQVIGPATEIPAIALAYFDPVKAAYQTVNSEPIALSVKGGTVVGSGDVVAIQRDRAGPAGTGPGGELSLVGADLALSAPDAALSEPLGGTWLWIVIGILYAVPLGLFVFKVQRVRGAARREEAGEVSAARRAFEYELAKAAAAPARDSVGPLIANVRAVARALGRDPGDDGLLARLETEAFAPDAATQPLSAAQRDAVLAVVRALLVADSADRRAGKRRGAGGAAAVLLLAGALVPRTADADALSEGRGAYDAAMIATDPEVRRASFREAAERFAQAAAASPDRPELLADWGNAALGAGDVATATLAFRRALALDGSNARARQNLAWVRGKQWVAVRPAGDGATDALFFFHAWPRGVRWLVGGVAFAIAVLLVVPWRGRSRRGLRALAIAPFAVWLAMGVSLVVEDRRGDDAVVMEGTVLRAADSAGAPAALSTPVPPGAEVEILERRDAWLRVRLGGGATGWVPAGTVERVARK